MTKLSTAVITAVILALASGCNTTDSLKQSAPGVYSAARQDITNARHKTAKALRSAADGID